MKYKVGDKVRVSESAIPGRLYGYMHFCDVMCKYRGKKATVTRVYASHYNLDIDKEAYNWTDEMLEPVEEMNALDAIQTFGDLCLNTNCCSCPIKKEIGVLGCPNALSRHPGDVLDAIIQWKASHEKKQIETELAWYAVIKDEKGNIVYEERIESPLGSNKEYLEKNKEILAKYCSEHDGKFYEVTERRCIVKE